MKDISVTQARNNLAEILNQVVYQAERFLIRRRGEPVAVLVSPDEITEEGQTSYSGVKPSKTAGVLSLEDSSLSIEDLYERLKKPYERKSLLGC